MSVFVVLIPLAFAMAEAISDWRKEKINGKLAFCLETSLTDIALVKKVLLSLDYEVAESEKQLEITIADKTRLRLQPNAKGTIDALFIGDIALDQGKEILQQIASEYGNLVQQLIYQRLKERSQNQGWTIENETVQEDNSLLLTLQV
jgi:hypothetical protein